MATSFHLVNNNAASVLAGAIDDNDLSAAVSTGDGAEFDTGKQYLTVGRTDSYAGEILDVTSRSSDTLTIASRGADGTTAVSHEAGDAVECLLVAAHITEIQDAINAIENGTVTLAQVKLGDDTGKLIFGNDSDIQYVYDEATDDRLEITDGTNVLGYWKDLGTTGMFGVTGRIECPQIGISADTDLLGLAANALTVNGTVTASSDTDSTHIFGRIRLHAAVSDFATFSHFDVSSSGGYALMHGATGNTYLNAVLGGSVSFRINNTAKGTLDGTKWDVAIPFTNSTITTFAANDTSPTVAAGNIFKVPATWTAGNNITTFDNGLTGQQITIIGGDSDCTVVDGSNLVMAGDWVAAPNATLTLIFDGTNWYERCRSAN